MTPDITRNAYQCLSGLRALAHSTAHGAIEDDRDRVGWWSAVGLHVASGLTGGLDFNIDCTSGACGQYNLRRV